MNLIRFVNDDEAKEDNVDDDDGETVDESSAEAILPVLQYLLCVGVRTRVCSSELQNLTKTSNIMDTIICY